MLCKAVFCFQASEIPVAQRSHSRFGESAKCSTPRLIWLSSFVFALSVERAGIVLHLLRLDERTIAKWKLGGFLRKKVALPSRERNAAGGTEAVVEFMTAKRSAVEIFQLTLARKWVSPSVTRQCIIDFSDLPRGRAEARRSKAAFIWVADTSELSLRSFRSYNVSDPHSLFAISLYHVFIVALRLGVYCFFTDARQVFAKSLVWTVVLHSGGFIAKELCKYSHCSLPLDGFKLRRSGATINSYTLMGFHFSLRKADFRGARCIECAVLFLAIFWQNYLCALWMACSSRNIVMLCLVVIIAHSIKGNHWCK